MTSLSVQHGALKIRSFHGRTADTYSCVHQVTKGGKVLEMPQLSLPKHSLTAAAATTPSSEKISVTLAVVPISTNWSFSLAPLFNYSQPSSTFKSPDPRGVENLTKEELQRQNFLFILVAIQEVYMGTDPFGVRKGKANIMVTWANIICMDTIIRDSRFNVHSLLDLLPETWI